MQGYRWLYCFTGCSICIWPFDVFILQVAISRRVLFYRQPSCFLDRSRQKTFPCFVTSEIRSIKWRRRKCRKFRLNGKVPVLLSDKEHGVDVALGSDVIWHSTLYNFNMAQFQQGGLFDFLFIALQKWNKPKLIGFQLNIKNNSSQNMTYNCSLVPRTEKFVSMTKNVHILPSKIAIH